MAQSKEALAAAVSEVASKEALAAAVAQEQGEAWGPKLALASMVAACLPLRPWSAVPVVPPSQ